MFNYAWFYNSTSKRAYRWTPATVNDVFGILLLPDLWEKPAGVVCGLLNYDSNEEIFYDEDEIEYATYEIPCNYNTYNIEQWEQMENNGAVFLPAAGYREGTSVSRVSDDGYYWTSSKHLDDYAKQLCFQNWGEDFDLLDIGGVLRHYGYSVRLVRDITPSDN